MSNIIKSARLLMAAMAPTTGERASAQVTVRSTTGSTVYLPVGAHLFPLVNHAAREDLLFKVGPGPFRAVFPNGIRKKASPDEPDVSSWWAIPPGGTTVDIHSLLGGKRHNLPAGTKLTFDPVIPGLDVSPLAAPATGGVDPGWLGGCMSMVQFEQLTASAAAADAFRSQVGKMPAVVLVWDGTEPADGTTQSSIDRGRTRVGSVAQLYKEQFNLFVITDRVDNAHKRRAEGLQLLDHIMFCLTDRQEVDGEIFSAPTGVQVRGRGRVGADAAAYQSFYIYLLQLSITTTWEPNETGVFAPWLRTHLETQTFEQDEDGDRLTTTDQDVDMSSPSE